MCLIESVCVVTVTVAASTPSPRPLLTVSHQEADVYRHVSSPSGDTSSPEQNILCLLNIVFVVGPAS